MKIVDFKANRDDEHANATSNKLRFKANWTEGEGEEESEVERERKRAKTLTWNNLVPHIMDVINSK